MRLGKNQDTYFNSVLTEGYQNPTEGSWEIFKKPSSTVLFSDYQTFANLPSGLCKINLQNKITCRIPSLQAILILKIRVARTLDQFQGPNVLRNRFFPSFSSFSNFSVAWVRPWICKISGHKIFWTMRLGRNQDTYFNRFWPKDFKIQRRDPEKSSINLPSAHFFATTKPSPICRRVSRVLL